MTLPIFIVVFLVLGGILGYALYKSFHKLLNLNYDRGAREGFNLAFFTTQDIILKSFSNNAWAKQQPYEIMKEILLESDVLLRKFYPEVNFEPNIQETLNKVEAEFAPNNVINFPNPGNKTLN
jgi:hypothetical protein